MFSWAIENGQIDEDHWTKFLKGEETDGAPSLDTEELPEGEVVKFISFANSKFYMRPSYMMKRLLNIRSFTQLVRQFQMGLTLILSKFS